MRKIGANSGISFIEMIVVIAILVILISIAAPVFIFFQRGLEFNNNIEEAINVLRIARNKTLASEGASQYGVYFDNTGSPHQYILFKGESFALRDDSFDEINDLPDNIEVYDIDLNGGNEIVFDRVTGSTSQPGSISLRLKTDLTKTKTIYIEGSGYVKLTAPVIPSDVNRVKDSRHVHFDYSNVIDTVSETLTLSFEGGVNKTIIIADNMKDGQIYWEGEVDVFGEIQKIKIHTHNLNNPNTLFCVHRDIRYNNKGLSIIISGDGSGTLIEYSADGSIIAPTSIYVTNLNSQ